MGLGALQTRLYVDADDRLAQGAQGFEAGVAEFETQLVFAFCLERVMAFVADGVNNAKGFGRSRSFLCATAEPLLLRI